MTAWRGGLPAVLADLARRQTRWTYRELAGHLAVPGPRTIRQVAEALDDSLRADHAAGRPLAAAVIVSARRGGLPAPGLYGRVLREVEHPLIVATLEITRGNQVRAADILGMNRNTLRKKIRDLNIRAGR